MAQAGTLRAGQAVERDCSGTLLPGSAAGVARSSLIADASGLLTVELLGGSRPDWDLAVFEQGDPIASSTSFTSAETATAPVERGDLIEIQACRLSGSAEEIELRTDLYPLEPTQRETELITLESVTLEEAGDVSRLERLGFDVTHDISSTSATVALYSDAERARLAGRGFDSTTLIPDLAAADAADRQAEAAAVAAEGDSTLPSTRESYRSYADYTTELKALADENPSFVRSVEVGRTIENRAIEGVEIAVDVQRTDGPSTSTSAPITLASGPRRSCRWSSRSIWSRATTPATRESSRC